MQSYEAYYSVIHFFHLTHCTTRELLLYFVIAVWSIALDKISECSSLYYIADPCWLSVLYIEACTSALHKFLGVFILRKGERGEEEITKKFLIQALSVWSISLWTKNISIWTLTLHLVISAVKLPLYHFLSSFSPFLFPPFLGHLLITGLPTFIPPFLIFSPLFLVTSP